MSLALASAAPVAPTTKAPAFVDGAAADGPPLPKMVVFRSESAPSVTAPVTVNVLVARLIVPLLRTDPPMVPEPVSVAPLKMVTLLTSVLSTIRVPDWTFVPPESSCVVPLASVHWVPVGSSPLSSSSSSSSPPPPPFSGSDAMTLSVVNLATFCSTPTPETVRLFVPAPVVAAMLPVNPPPTRVMVFTAPATSRIVMLPLSVPSFTSVNWR